MKENKKPTIPEVIPLIEAYYLKPGNSLGGSLHIVLEDGNIEKKHVGWCIEFARKEDDVDGVRLGEILLKLSKTQLRTLYRSFDYYPPLDRT